MTPDTQVISRAVPATQPIVPLPPGQLTATILVTATPDAAFAAICNVRQWWTGEITGNSAALGDRFTYRYKQMHTSTQEVTEMVPGRRIAWQVLASNLSFLSDPSEWAGTSIVFDIEPAGGQTRIRLTHVGLTAQSECYDACASGWGSLVNGGLKTLIETGTSRLVAL